MDGRRRGKREEGEEPSVSKHQIQPRYGDWAGYRGTERSNLSFATIFSGANGNREHFIFPF